MNSQSHSYHTPVLLGESIDALNIKSTGTYVDVTYGGGGHSKPILDRLSAEGHLYAFDQDEAAKANVVDDDRMTFIRSNFSYLEHYMRFYEVDGVDGILADLGVSSHHFDEEERGFSYRFDSLLDMRMNQSASRTAQEVIANTSKEELVSIFSRYGELRNSKTFADRLVKARSRSPILSVNDLLAVIDDAYRGDKQRYTAQVFQALRMEVNDELGVLERFLDAAVGLLHPGGRLVVITYHSLEDKLVKRHLKFGAGAQETDMYGRVVSSLLPITRKPIVPKDDEIKINSRAASAKLRVVEKL